MLSNQGLSIRLWTNLSEDVVCRRVGELVRQEGLEVASQMDASGLIESETGLRLEKFTILNVWNPLASYYALLASPEAGFFVPFRIVVASYHGGTLVAAMNPRWLAELADAIDKLSFELLVTEISAKFGRILRALEAAVAAEGTQKVA